MLLSFSGSIVIRVPPQRPGSALEWNETMTVLWLEVARRPKPYESVVIIAVTMVAALAYVAKVR